MTSLDGCALLMNSDGEIQVQDLIKCGEIDQAIALYQQLKPKSAHLFHTIGVLYAERKGDYQSALDYYERALQIQEKNGDDTSDTLTKIAFAYQMLGQFDLALIYHLRALTLREAIDNIDQRLIANNLFGIANAYWGQRNLSEALIYAQRALTLNESIKSENDSNIASNLAILANIYYYSGDDIHALELAEQALILLERCVSSDSPALASLLNNIGTIQVGVGLFNNALLTFIRVAHISEKNLPEKHPTRITIGNNIRRVIEMQQQNGVNSFSDLWKLWTKFSLL